MAFTGESVKPSFARSYDKLKPGVLAIPALFYFLGSVLLIYTIYRFFDLLGRIASEITTAQQYDVEELAMLIYHFSWTFLMYFGFTASTMVSSYILLRYFREHYYYSAFEVYSVKRGEQPELAVRLVESFVERSSLPTPITGLLLAFLTAGVSYPVILSMAEVSARRHSALEEEVVLGTRYTRTKSGAWVAFDFFVFLVTLGLYLVYMSWRLTTVVNNHLRLVHSPTTGETSTQTRIQEGTSSPPVTLTLGLYLLALSFVVALLYSGVPGYFMAYTTGIALSLVPIVLRKKRFLTTVIVIFLMLYSSVVAGVLGGIAAFEQYSFLFEQSRESLKWMTRSPLELCVNIFLNNFALSAPAAVPAIGGLYLVQGSFNAGFILGIGVALGAVPVYALLILVFPHAILEILAYAVIASSSMYYTEPKRFLAAFSLGVMVLLLAAVVETITIELGKMF